MECDRVLLCLVTSCLASTLVFAQTGIGPIDNVVKEGGKVVKGAGGAVGSVLGGAGQVTGAVFEVGRHTVETIVDQPKRVATTIFKATDDAYATVTKGMNDLGRESAKAWDDSVDAVRATERFTERQAKGTVTRFQKVAQEAAQGRLVEAAWESSIGGYRDSEKNFFMATQESEVISVAGSTAAAVYGGPAGASAYAAWATYRATGDANLAFKAGLIAAASSQAGKVTSSMPTGTLGKIVQKAAVAGAAGGIAVAAAGGDENAIKNAFLKSGGQVIVQAGTDAAKGYSPKAVESAQIIQCISARDVDCLSKVRYVVDHGKLLHDRYFKPLQSKLDPDDLVGQWTEVAQTNTEAAYKKVLEISKLPDRQQIPLMSNKWVLTYSFGKDIAYGTPVVVLTEVGKTPPFVFKRKYSRSAAAARQLGGSAGRQKVSTKIRRTSVSYVCPVNQFNRIVSAAPYGHGCKAVYQKEQGVEQIIFRTDRSRGECVKRAARFVETNLKPLKCHKDG